MKKRSVILKDKHNLAKEVLRSMGLTVIKRYRNG